MDRYSIEHYDLENYTPSSEQVYDQAFQKGYHMRLTLPYQLIYTLGTLDI